MIQIYDCRPSFEEWRPKIDFDLMENAHNDWLTIGKVQNGTLPTSAYPKSVNLLINEPKATDWDCFMVAGTSGVFSMRFLAAVGSDSLRNISLLPVRVNGDEYVLLRRDRGIDCLDLTDSLVERYPHDSTRIMDILHYAFTPAVPMDAALFYIPQSLQLLATEPMARRIDDAALRGVYLSTLP